MSLQVGDLFSSFDELRTKLSEYQKENGIQLYIRDSRTVEAAKKKYRLSDKNFKQSLRYYEIKLSCIFGGKKYQSKIKSSKDQGETETEPEKLAANQLECQMDMRVMATPDGQYLKISKLNENHNHPLGLSEITTVSRTVSAVDVPVKVRLSKTLLHEGSPRSRSQSNKANKRKIHSMHAENILSGDSENRTNCTHYSFNGCTSEKRTKSIVDSAESSLERNEKTFAAADFIKADDSTLQNSANSTTDSSSINLGNQLKRWKILKEQLHLDSDERLAEFLLNHLEGEIKILSPTEEESRPSFLSNSQLCLQNHHRETSDLEIENLDESFGNVPDNISSKDQGETQEERQVHSDTQSFLSHLLTPERFESRVVTQYIEKSYDAEQNSTSVKQKMPLCVLNYSAESHSSTDKFEKNPHRSKLESPVVNLGKQHQRWMYLKEKLQIETDEDLAKFLIDHQISQQS